MLIKLSDPSQVDQVIERLSKIKWITADYIDIINAQKKTIEGYIRSFGAMFLVLEAYFDHNLGFVPIIRFFPDKDIFPAQLFREMTKEALNGLLGVW